MSHATRYQPDGDKIIRVQAQMATIENGFVHLPEKAALASGLCPIRMKLGGTAPSSAVASRCADADGSGLPAHSNSRGVSWSGATYRTMKCLAELSRSTISR